MYNMEEEPAAEEKIEPEMEEAINELKVTEGVRGSKEDPLDKSK